MPIMKPNRPIHAVNRCTIGRSKNGPSLPILLRSAVKVKRKKNTMVNASETAMKTGVVAVGADSSCDEIPCDKTDKSVEERHRH